MGMLVFSRKKMRKIGPVFIYRCMFISDSIYLLNMINPFVLNLIGKSLTTISDLACKITLYLAFCFFTLIPMLLVYISAERIVSIKYPSKRFQMRQIKWQIAYIVAVIAVGLVLFLPALFYVGLHKITSSGNSSSHNHLNNVQAIYYVCTFSSAYDQDLVTITNILIRLLAFRSMFFLSLFLIVSIFYLIKKKNFAKFFGKFKPNCNSKAQ